jgi:sugar phosphate isomerase/epimerase
MPEADMELGIGTYSYMWTLGEKALGAHGLLALATELGVRRVQFGPNHPLTQGGAPEIVRDAKERGLTLEIGMAGLDTEEIRRQLDLCLETGSPLLRTVLQESLEGAPGREWIEERLEAALPHLEKARIPLALENSVTPAADLAALLNRPWLGATLDTVNSLAICEGWRYVTGLLAPLTLCFHVKDFIVRREPHKMGFRVEGRPAGQGHLDIPWILARLGARCQSAILELWPPEQATIQETIELERTWAADSIATLRGWIPD